MFTGNKNTWVHPRMHLLGRRALTREPSNYAVLVHCCVCACEWWCGNWRWCLYLSLEQKEEKWNWKMICTPLTPDAHPPTTLKIVSFQDSVLCFLQDSFIHRLCSTNHKSELFVGVHWIQSLLNTCKMTPFYANNLTSSNMLPKKFQSHFHVQPTSLAFS